MPAKVTIHEVAAAAGVSIKTVSRVLREEATGFSEATRQRVMATVQRLNYALDASASALSSGIAQVIGQVSARFDELPLARSGAEYRMSMQTGTLTACQDLGFGLRVVRFLKDDQAPALDLIERVRRKEIGGYVIPSPSCEWPGVLDALDAAGVRYATISPLAERAGVPSVSADDRASMRQMAELVIGHGHRRIAFIRGQAQWRDTEERYAGFLDAMTLAGIAVDPAFVEQGNYTFDSGRECGRRLLGMPRRPTAIIASSDDMAAGVLSVAHELGLKLPAELSVTGYDNMDLARKLWPALTTVHRPIEKMAELAARQVIALLQPNRAGVQLPQLQLQMHSELVQRGSLAAAPVLDKR